MSDSRAPTRRGAIALLAVPAAMLGGCAAATPGADPVAAREQVQAVERAFAQTMARRDLAAFGSFIAQDAVFFTGPAPLRGRQQVLDYWARWFKEPQAPFSWEPDRTEVLASGTLAHSSGPVRNAEGKAISRFNSIWRLESPGIWRVVFDGN